MSSSWGISSFKYTPPGGFGDEPWHTGKIAVCKAAELRSVLCFTLHFEEKPEGKHSTAIQSGFHVLDVNTRRKNWRAWKTWKTAAFNNNRIYILTCLDLLS